MVEFDFDQLISREHTHSVKWKDTDEAFGVKDAIPMWIADMDFETVPQVKDALIERAKHGIFGYTYRSESYYQAVTDWYLKRNSWAVHKDWIVHSTGVVNALYNVIRAFSEEGDGILIQPPVYHPFYKAITRAGRTIVHNPLRIVEDKYQIDFEDFEKKLSHGNVKLFILCNPHNPVGRVFTEEELTLLGELCIKHRVLVISDEIHSDLVFKNYRHIPFASISKVFEQNSVICTAPSKTFNLAGLSTSNIIIPNEKLRERYESACEDIALKSLNIFGAVASEAAYTHGEEWLDQLLDYIEENKSFALEYVKNNIPQLKLLDTEGTYFLWLDCRELGLDINGLEQFMLHKAKLWLNQGYIFGKEGEGFVRINIATQRAIVEEALVRLKNAVNEL